MINSSYLTIGSLYAPRQSTSPFAFSTGYLALYSSLSASRTSRAASSTRLDGLSASYKVALSDLGKLKGALASFQTSARALTGSGLSLLTVNSSDTTVLSTTSGNGTVAGSYAVVVNALAQGQTLSSSSQSSATAAIGTGTTTTVSFEFGTTVGATFTPTTGQATKSITIGSSNNSLQGIAAAVNAANFGVSASITFDGTGYKLSLTSPTGDVNSLRISVAGDAALQGLLLFDPAGTKNLTQTAVAQNASLTVDGLAVSSSGNTITGVIAGTTLNLKGAGSSTVVVAPDATRIASKITSFLSAYNTLQSSFNTLGGGRFDANLFPRVQDKLAATIRSTPYGFANTPYNSLAQLGIGTGSGGTLSADITKLQNAIIANPSVVTSLFANNGSGIADALVTQIDRLIGVQGTLERRSASLSQSASVIDSARVDLAGVNQRQARSYYRLAQHLNTYQNIYNLLTSL